MSRAHHDLGGRPAGAIDRTDRELEPWEKRVDAILRLLSAPERGVSAVYRMAKVLAAVEHYAERLQAKHAHPPLGPATLSVGLIRGGVSPNTVPDACAIHLDRRLLPGENGTEAMDDVTRFVRDCLVSCCAACVGGPVVADAAGDHESDAHDRELRVHADARG